ncbi:UNVERIFIED_CONTAM: hypothetical protein GTU68_052119 [Idotea baltica]|nr:hypothetical protein [Idotea baltica]
MLQQTQVNTVQPYFKNFIKRFPSIYDLAQAPLDVVLHIWTGLGYYSRARNLHKTAQIIVEKFSGVFPSTLQELIALPGIGRSTAGAIMSISMKLRAPILDGNVKRVLTRYKAIEGHPSITSVSNKLWALSEELTPFTRVDDYTQAIMDLGATLCTRNKPQCFSCPLKQHCKAHLIGAETSYPTPKIKKSVPLKSICILLFIDKIANKILLQKRPEKGLWGGLWSLPECNSVSESIPIAKKLHMRCFEKYPIKEFSHKFSHLMLTMQPWIVEIKCLDSSQFKINNNWYWYDLKSPEPKELGMAAPIKKLLTQNHINFKQREIIS